ncbi:Lnb N-terminal periplasmic domain-containing protein [Achromobacter marplatensis]|uniref:Lnb N-terminal periplasmic domain-containing protein n=1 Tax=Achromobacter marplatensis TaxID=470868 RepID=UPI0039F6B4B3
MPADSQVLHGRLRRGVAIVGRVVGSLLVAGSALWGMLALAYQAPGGVWGKGAAALLWAGLCAGALVALWRRGRWRRRAGWLYLAGLVTLCSGWQTLSPSNDRVWADDVARMLRGTVQGPVVTLENVRNFDWRSDDDYTPRWETRQYNLDQLVAVDMALSYWSGPAIAHTLVSFGFSDGRHVVFSVEIRKERGEKFSEIGGFFKQFELSVVAAEERDILYVRAGPRGESVYLYPVRMPATAMRELFLSYVTTANALVDTPRFYHTVTANCTTLVYQMVRAIVPGLPLDTRILLSGYLPEYLYEQGGLDASVPLEVLRQQAAVGPLTAPGDDPVAFSRQIRRHGAPAPARPNP